RAETEVQTRIAVGRETCATDEVETLAQLAGRRIDARAGRIARASLRRVADEFYAEPMVRGLRDVVQDGWRRVAVVDDSVEFAIAVEVCDGQTACRPSLSQCAAGRCADALEAPVRKIAKQQRLLGPRRAPRVLVN